MIRCFEPIVDSQCKLVILGSMPGEESLKQQQYYAFKRNQFWKMIYLIFGEVLSDDYNEKKSFLLKHNIALWDVLKNCEREGSLDSKIKNETANDFEGFFNRYPNLKYVSFNGTKAYHSFKKYVGFDLKSNLEYFQLPSTSPANTQRLEEKIKAWERIKNLV
ncbi:DNA-deoxyinosine glycosylase [Marinisporobacter balticus]|uniref:G/U mismatch-specific uracil-DNA glycosylase n=1 Tax=Marinisporobacter balticus TaxID=2018667 RepID=A0A4R2KRB9_9FIRM|nr:DNA-deoxyinosine glycosylase [Marinisporobacter balticus]TCO72678.1 G/U mismatch-specific uracil-DNA glycosylase [Marinisporobacter balticus]